MKKNSIFKIFFLLNALFKKDLTKKEIIENFKRIDVLISPSLISNYIKKLVEMGFCVETKENEKREKIYKIKKPKSKIAFSKENLDLIRELKLLVFAKKDFRYIETLMELFCLISKEIKDKDIKEKFLDFGYFSSLDLKLIKQLKNSIEEKEAILIDYQINKKEIKKIEFFPKELALGDFSKRLYLVGFLKEANSIFRLPVDKIKNIKKTLKVEYKEEEKEFFTFKLSKENLEFFELNKNERILKDEKDYITIEKYNQDDFSTLQRLLYFCPNLCYISNKKIKNLLIEKLEKIEKLYE